MAWLLKDKKYREGYIKTVISRSFWYMNLIRTLMIAAIFFATFKWSWWYLIAVPAFIVLMIYDMGRMFTQEIDVYYKKSEIFMDMKKKIDELYERK